MTEINITGASPAGPNSSPQNTIGDNKFSNDAWRNAHLENANLNARLNAQRRLAEYENNHMDAQYKRTRALAEYEDKDFDKRWKQAHTMAQYENKNFDARIKQIRTEADYENKNFDSRLRHMRQEADYENREFNARKKKQDQEYRDARKLAEYEENDRKLKQREADKKYREDYALAQLMNKDYDMRMNRGSFGKGFASGFAGGNGVGGRIGGGFISGIESLPGVGPLIATALGAAKDLFMAPQELMGTLNGLYGAAKPMIDLRLAGAQIGRASGFSNSAYAESLIDGSQTAWMRSFGVTPQDVAPVLGAYGMSRLGSTGNAMATASDIFSLSQSNYLGAFSPTQIGQMAGNARTLMGGGNPMESEGLGLGNGTFLDKYFRKMQDIFATGVSRGLDSSQVGNTLTQMMQLSAASGASQINMDSLGGLWSRLSSSGNPLMRSGEGVVAFQQALQNNIGSQGYGGNTMGTAAFSYEVNKRGGLKNLTSSQSVAKMFGIDYGNATPETKYLLENAAKAARSGNSLAFATAAAPLEQSSPTFSIKAAEDLVSGMAPNMTGVQRDYMVAQIAGISYSQYAAYKSGTTNGLASGGGFSPVNPINGPLSGVINSAASNAGVNPQLLGALISRESSGKLGAVNTTSGDAGLGQVSPDTLKWAQSKGYVDKNISFNELTTDTAKSAAATAGVLKMYMDMNNGNVTQALLGYGGFKDKNGNILPGKLAKAQEYVGSIESGADPQGIAQTNVVLSNLGQGNTMAAQGAEAALDGALSGSNGDAIVSFTQATTGFQSSVAQFSAAVTSWVTGLTSGPKINGIPAQLVKHPERMPRTP